MRVEQFFNLVEHFRGKEPRLPIDKLEIVVWHGENQSTLKDTVFMSGRSIVLNAQLNSDLVPMKLWLVSVHDDESQRLVGIFSSEEKATALKHKVQKVIDDRQTHWHYVFTTERTLDEVTW